MTGTNETGRPDRLRDDVAGSIPLRAAPMLMFGLSVLVLVILYVTTT